MNEHQKILLGVNIDHVATLRQARGESYPEPVRAAVMAVNAGADSITVHLREDRRHIQEDDVRSIRDTVKAPLNLEMAATAEMIEFALAVRPDYCCIVPEKREELTTEGGLDVVSAVDDLGMLCKQLQASGIRVSLFIDADENQITAAKQTGAEMIEIHTGQYANAGNSNNRASELERINQAVTSGKLLGLQVNAGHGLHYENVTAIASNRDITELNIGHSIVARAIFTGMETAVSEMKRIMLEARQ
ncbi:MAG: pyridoxine 5'-phosphate synthase [Gammaproteobacteria bacterium]|nr:pyridoxine 5'-phosphate synthase [Gammaproteobacteria bacterium]